LRRLDSAVRIDFPERRSRLVLGDSVSAAGVTGRGWRFGGLQWTTDFDLAPELPTFALPAAKGVATVPSTVDLYVNGALIGNRNVNAGPFEIPDIPVPTGAGTVMLRVRDVLGREQYYEQRFLTTPLLLPAGTSAQALEAGSLRTDYGGESFGYKQGFVAASMRRGMNTAITLETQLEVSATQAAARVAGAMRLGDHLVVQLGSGLSQHDGGQAQMADLTLDWNADFLSVSLQGRRFDRNFRDLTFARAGRATQEWSGQLSPRLPFAGSVGVAFTARRGAGPGSNVAVTTLFASLARVAGGSLQAQVSRLAAQRKEIQAGLSFVRVLGGGQSSSVNLFRDGRGLSMDAQMGQSAPHDQGWGWNLGTHQGQDARYAARVEARTARGNGDLQLAQGDGGLGGTASWNGGWLRAAGGTYATRTLSSAIAVIETPGVTGAQVLHDGQNLGHTNRNGRLVATSLRPYEPNQLRLDTTDVPVGAWIEDNSMTIAPYTRGVVYLRFDTQAAASTLTLKLADGHFVPAGARIGIEDRSYPVGDNGRVSLPLASGRQTLRASWHGAACEVALRSVESSQELLCRPITH
jgi:outer membrane usher protein